MLNLEFVQLLWETVTDTGNTFRAAALVVVLGVVLFGGVVAILQVPGGFALCCWLLGGRTFRRAAAQWRGGRQSADDDGVGDVTPAGPC